MDWFSGLAPQIQFQWNEINPYYYTLDVVDWPPKSNFSGIGLMSFHHIVDVVDWSTQS
jgi:hypothetical protein